MNITHIRPFSSFKAILLVTMAAVFTLPWRVYAGDQSYESYFVRPNILDDHLVSARPHSELPKPWNKMKPAHLEAVIEILEMYPKEEIYFLARDAELLYDLAQLITHDEPEQSKRIHLLNISRANMRDPHVKNYLEQEGISTASLKNGKQVLFVDTGFSGTIPSVIAENFSEKLKGHLKTHLICSANPRHPSTRVFLQHLNPAAVDSDPSGFNGTVISYENLPRYTDRSDRFDEKESSHGRKWAPMSSTKGQSDGSVSKEKALAYMEDLKAYARSPEAQELMKTLKARWSGLAGLLKEGVSNQEVETPLRSLLADKNPHGEAIVRDFLEIIHRNFSELTAKVTLGPEDLGLKLVQSDLSGNKLALMEKYPQWKSILEDPQNGISKLIHSGEFQTLRSILDVIDDYEFMELAIKELSKEQYVENLETEKEIRQTLQGVIEKGDSIDLYGIAVLFLSKPHTSSWKDELKKLVNQLEPVDKRLSSALLAEHDYPWGDPLHAIGRPEIKYTRASTDHQWVIRHEKLAHKYGEPFKKAFAKAWKDPRKLVWGNTIQKEDRSDYLMNHGQAVKYCKAMGADLPAAKDFDALSKDLGLGASWGYIPQFLPKLYRHSYWSSSVDLDHPGRVHDFNGDNGFILSTDPKLKLAVRCVVRVH